MTRPIDDRIVGGIEIKELRIKFNVPLDFHGEENPRYANGVILEYALKDVKGAPHGEVHRKARTVDIGLYPVEPRDFLVNLHKEVATWFAEDLWDLAEEEE